MPNTELLEQVMTHITDHPELHNQGSFLGKDCGTACCFAGWALHFTQDQEDLEQMAEVYNDRSQLGSSKTKAFATKWDDNIARITKTATAELGITEADAEILFEANNSAAVLELMVKDILNGDPLRPSEEYRDE